MRALAVTVLAAVFMVAGAAPASATPGKAPKPPNPCKALTPDDLKLVFAQPWRKGVEQVGGACTFDRPTDSKVPNIVVALIVERKRSVRKAKQAFARGRQATEDVAGQIENIRKVGDEAHLATILGAEVLSFRAGRDLVEIRVDRVDKPEETYRDQVLTVGDIVEARLHLPPEKGPSGG